MKRQKWATPCLHYTENCVLEKTLDTSLHYCKYSGCINLLLKIVPCKYTVKGNVCLKLQCPTVLLQTAFGGWKVFRNSAGSRHMDYYVAVVMIIHAITARLCINGWQPPT